MYSSSDACGCARACYVRARTACTRHEWVHELERCSILDALRAGARGYLTKNAGRTDIARALHGAVNGQSILDSDVQATLLGIAGVPRSAKSTIPRLLPDDLTAREAEVLVLIGQGLTNRDIAASLYLSAHTVKTHINRIFAKTGAKNRAQAILYAQNHGLSNVGPTDPG